MVKDSRRVQEARPGAAAFSAGFWAGRRRLLGAGESSAGRSAGWGGGREEGKRVGKVGGGDSMTV